MRRQDLGALSDEALLEAARNGRGLSVGADAASALLERYQERVYVWCYRLVRDHEQALDLAQEALLNAYRGLGGFQGRSGFASWLFAIARNRCLSALRRPSPLEEGDDGRKEVADPRPGQDVELEVRLEEEAMLELVRKHLDPVEQQAIWLRCFEGLPVDEITRLLHIDAATGARSILQRARRKLRAALEGTPRAIGDQGGPNKP